MGPMTESGEVFSYRSERQLFLDAVREGMRVRVDIPRTDSVCVFGTDSCSIAGEVLSDAADELSSHPLTCVRDGRIPGWVGPGTEAILVSYEGDCQEAFPVLEALRGRGCGIHVLTAGGTICNPLHPSEMVLLPMGLEGHEAMGYVLGALAATVQATGLFDAADALESALEALEEDAGHSDDDAVLVARALEGNVGAVYSTSDVHASAVSFRESLSDAGHLSFTGELPEFDHNELVGWSDPNVHAPELRMVVLKGGSPSDLVNTIVDCMAEVLRENGREVVEVDIGSGSSLQRNLCGMLVGMDVADLMGGRR